MCEGSGGRSLGRGGEEEEGEKDLLRGYLEERGADIGMCKVNK